MTNREDEDEKRGRKRGRGNTVSRPTGKEVSEGQDRHYACLAGHVACCQGERTRLSPKSIVEGRNWTI